MEGTRNENKMLFGKTREKWSLGRPDREWENNIKMDLKEIGRENVNWTELAQNRVQWWLSGKTVLISGFCKIRNISLRGEWLSVVQVRPPCWS